MCSVSQLTCATMTSSHNFSMSIMRYTCVLLKSSRVFVVFCKAKSTHALYLCPFDSLSKCLISTLSLVVVVGWLVGFGLNPDGWIYKTEKI